MRPVQTIFLGGSHISYLFLSAQNISAIQVDFQSIYMQFEFEYISNLR